MGVQISRRHPHCHKHMEYRDEMCIRDRDSRRTGGQPSLNLDLIESQGQTAHQPFFLLEDVYKRQV